MNILNRGYWATTLLSVVGLLITTNLMMSTGTQTGPDGLPDLGLLLRCRPRRPR